MSARSLGNVVVAIKAVDEASGVMGKIQASLGLLGGALQNLGGGFAAVGGIIQGFAAGGVAGAAIGAFSEIAKGLQQSVEDAGLSEQAFKDLQVAVEKSGTAWDIVSNATKEYLLNLQKVTVYSDEQVAGALQRLLTFGLDYDQAMKALKETVDLAAAKHLDLETAASLVGKAFQGNTSILRRYGIEVQTTKDATAAFNGVMDSLGAALEKAGADQLSAFAAAMADVGLQSQNASGKMLPVGKLLTEIKDAFKAGTLDAAQFGEICGSLGVKFDASKMSAADFQGVLDALNKQFGGTAQEQANTYVGIQERLKNAMSELSEKVGMILLPALSGIAEQIIPVVTGFGQWVAEIAAMPDVKAIVAGVAQGFADTVKNMVDVTKAFEDTNTALTELLDSVGVKLPEGFSALNIIAKGFSYTWDMLVTTPLKITMMILEGLTSIFKTASNVITDAVKGITDAIGGAVHQIELFTQGFNTAADVAVPTVKTIQDAISATLKSIQDALQAFYDWFVGGSMWQDMWNAVISILQAAVPTIQGILSGDLLKPIIDMLSGLGSQVQDLWTAAWTGLAEKFSSLTSAIQGTVSGVFDPLGAYLEVMFTQWAEWASNALAKVEGAITSSAQNLSAWLMSFMGTVYQAWVDFGAAMSTYMTMVVNAIIATLQGAAVSEQGILNGMIDAARNAANTIGGILAQIATSIQNTVNQAANAAGIGGNAITNAFSGAWNSVATAATNFYNWLVGHSLWPDLMSSLVDQTQAGMSEVKASFEKGLSGLVLNAPTIPELTAAMNITRPESAAANRTGASPAAIPQTINIPITTTLQVDGATFTRVIERRLISNRQLSVWRSA
jgi:phage-related protein